MKELLALIGNYIKLRILFTGLTSLMLFSVCRAQQPEWQEKILNGYVIKWREWTKEHGVDELQIVALVRNSSGHIWFKNGNKLARFNGTSIENIAEFNLSIKHANVNILQDLHGNVWVLHRDEITVYLVKEQRAVPLKEYVQQSVESSTQTRMVEHNGVIYVISKVNRTIWRYDGKWKKSIQLQNPIVQKNEYSDIYAAPNDHVWLKQQNTIVLFDSLGTVTKSISVNDNQKLAYGNLRYFLIESLKNKPGFVYVEDCFSGESDTTRLPVNKSLLSICETDSCMKYTFVNIVRRRDNRENKYHGKREEVSDSILGQSTNNWHYPFQLGRPPFTERNIFYSFQDNSLVYGKRFSLMQMHIQPLDFESILKDKSIRTIQWSGDSALISFAAHTAFVYKYHLNDNEIQELNLNDQQLNGQSIFGYFGNKRSVDTWHLGDTLQIEKISEAYEGVLWRFVDHKSNTWLCTYNGLYNETEQQLYLNSIFEDGLRINHVYEDDEGVFWLSSHKGLVKWVPYADSYEIYGKASNFCSEELHAVYPDTLGRLWISSNDGIIAFNPQTLEVTNYTNAIGMAGTEQNFLAHALSPKGLLYFGGVNGITFFDPNKISKQSITQDFPAISIDSVQLIAQDGNLVKKAIDIPNLDLKASNFQVRIPLKVLHFGSEKHHYAWRVKSLSERWVAFHPDRPIILTNLPGGKHILEVKSWPEGNPHIEKVYSFNMNKHFFIYEHWWFWAIIVLFIGIVFWKLIEYRQVQLQLRNKMLETEVAKQTSELLKQKQKLEDINLSRTELFNNISHEFRTPLGIIQGNTQLMLKERKFNVASLETIETQGKRLATMTNEVLDLTKMDEGTLSLNLVNIEWKDFVTRVFSSFNVLAHQKALFYTLSLEPESELMLQMDKTKMERVLSNVIGNAIKFTSEYGRVSVKGTLKKQNLEIEVSDTGPGIPVDEQEDIFDRFKQGSASKNQAQPGYGIGLALCKQYVELMNGKIWVESDEGIGSTFYLNIPMNSIQTNVINSSDQSVYTKNEISLKPLKDRIDEDNFQHKILIVEDQPEMLEFLTTVLSKEYNVCAVSNGLEAWKILIEKGENISLILSDAMMPLIDGFTLLQKVRGNKSLATLPFILLTALTKLDSRFKALRMGVDMYLTKPFELTELELVVANLLRQVTERKRYIAERGQQALEGMQAENSENEPAEYDAKWLDSLEKVISDNLGDNSFRVPDIAILMNMSERSLFDSVKLLTGLSPSDYLKKVRVQQAKLWIEQRKYRTTKELTYAVGLRDYNSFTTAFKEFYGITPAQMLKRK